MRYIETWLSGLGLEYIIPKLRAQGITTPKKLAALSLRDIYEVVGVDDADDRKKLYFLIRRLKSILQSKDHGNSEEDEQDDLETGSNNVYENFADSNSPQQELRRQEDFSNLSAGERVEEPTQQPLTALRTISTAPPKTLETEELPGSYPRNPMINVVIRKRPLSAHEKQRGDRDIIFVRGNGVMDLRDVKIKVDLSRVLQTMRFQFDNAFDENASNRSLYNGCLEGSIPALLDDVTVSCFTFGPTGSGKTHTMYGTAQDPGLYTQAISDLLKLLPPTLQLSVTCFEIYGEKLFDLLNERNLIKCLEDKKQRVCFPGLTEHPISTVDEFTSLLQSIASNRSTSSTRANHDSSRSHQVLQLSLLRPGAGRRPACGKLVFVDLAGSENAAETMNSSRSTRMEGAEINTSLLALKEVFRSLGKNGHTPFRGSKLTQVLKESLQGKIKTCMIVCVSPSSSSHEQTVNSLRYAAKVYDLGGGEPCEGPVTEVGDLTEHRSADDAVNGERQSVAPSLGISSKTRSASASRGMIRPRLASPHAAANQEQYRAVAEKENSGAMSANDVIHGTSRRKSVRKVQQENPVKQQQQNVIDESSVIHAWSLLSVHKNSIADMVELMKEEMELVQNMENIDDRDTNAYISRLQQILTVKTATIANLKAELHRYAETS